MYDNTILSNTNAYTDHLVPSSPARQGQPQFSDIVMFRHPTTPNTNAHTNHLVPSSPASQEQPQFFGSPLNLTDLYSHYVEEHNPADQVVPGSPIGAAYNEQVVPGSPIGAAPNEQVVPGSPTGPAANEQVAPSEQAFPRVPFYP